MTTAERAATWWYDKIFAFSIPTENKKSDCPWINAFMPKSVEKGDLVTPSTLEHFYHELFITIKFELENNDSITLSTMGEGPIGLLAEVCQKTGIPDDVLPCNTTMQIIDGKIIVTDENNQQRLCQVICVSFFKFFYNRWLKCDKIIVVDYIFLISPKSIK